MRKLPALKIIFSASFVISIFLTFSTTSCTKTETVMVQLDSINTVKNLMFGKWNVRSVEHTLYSGTTVTGGNIEYLSGTNTFTEYKADMTYTSTYKGAAAGGGTWEILSPYYMVLDKGNATQERYYYITALDKAVQITHGPFKQNGALFLSNDLYYVYQAK